MIKFFILRPVTSLMLMLSFILIGLYSLRLIPVDLLPNVDFPVVSINTLYPGADAKTVDVNVTRIIEDELAGISGREAIISSSFAGVSRVQVFFSLDKDIDVAAQEVRDAVLRAYRRMPEGVEPPLVRKIDTSLSPVFVVLLYSKGADYQTLAYFADKLVKRDFEKVTGVGSVDLGGFRDNVLWVRLDPERLYSRELTPLDVVNAISRNHLEAPAGRIELKNREYILRLQGKFQSPEEFNELYIKGGIKLKDVGRAYFDSDEFRSQARFKGKEAIALVIYKESNANTVSVVDEVKKRMKKWEELLPPNIGISYTFDASEFIRANVRAAFEEIIIGSILTGVVIYVFLGALRLTIIPLFAIPVTLLGTVFFLYLFKNSLNTFTLLGLAVAVGLVIDDAIVVLESIYRRKQEGLPQLEAGIEGTRVVIFALLASTASLIVVFLPVIFLKGIVGKLFGSFALTLVIAIALSYLVALSFTPSASARLVRETPENFFMKVYNRLENAFDRALIFSLNHKPVVILASLLAVAGGFFAFKFVKKEFFPLTDENRFLIRFETPVGSSFEFTQKKAEEIEKILFSNPYIDRFGIAIGEGIAGRPDVNGGIGFVYLKKERRPHMKVIMDELRKEFRKLKDVRVSVEPPSIVGVGGGRTTDIQYVVKGPSLEVLKEIAEKMEAHFRGVPGFVDVDTNLRLNEPQVKIRINREKAGDLGIDVKDVADTLNILFGKFKLGSYELGAESYDLYVKADQDFTKNLGSLEKVYIRTKEGKLVPITEVVEYSLETGYKVINRYDRTYSFFFYANLAGDRNLSLAIDKVESWLKENLPPGYTYEPAGEAKEFRRAMQGFVFSLIVALVGVYMVLASLFESLVTPFIVLLMVPLVALGASFFLILTNTSFSVPTFFGVILLVGIIVRDAVLFIERIIQLREEGYSVREAIIQARRERLRPILMTTITVVSALIPPLLGLTTGSELRKPLAAAVIGGIITGLPLSLFLLPVLYEITESIKLKRFKLR